MAKLPSFQFYPGDWRKDPELSRASKAEKGMLIDLMCLMHEAEDRGILATSREPWSDEDVAAAAGGDLATNLILLQGLLRKGILRRNTSGAVFSARMVRDEQRRQQNQNNGLNGGNPILLKGGVKGGVNPNPTPPVNRNPTPSSSGSSSASDSTSKPTPKPSADTSMDGWEGFWKEYPRHTAKQAAMKAWKKINPTPELIVTILKAIDIQKKQPGWIKDGGQFIPHPATWINGRRWEDAMEIKTGPRPGEPGYQVTDLDRVIAAYRDA